MLIGYARVSRESQDTAAQASALQAAGCSVIHEETGSGGDRKRPVLAQVLASLRAGDTLCVWKMDRVARSLPHLIEIMADLEKRTIQFRSLTEAIDTSTPAGRLIFHVFGALGEFERGLISERTMFGLAAARAAGRIGGNPMLKTPEGCAALAAIRASNRAARQAQSPTPNAPAKPPDPRVVVVSALCRDGIPSLRTLGRQLAEAGLSPPKGGTWAASSVQALVHRMQRQQGASP